MKSLKIIGPVLVILGILFLAYPLFTHLKAGYHQDKMSSELADTGEAVEEETEVNILDDIDMPSVEDLDGKVKIKIPKIDVSAVVVYGTSEQQLDKGPGFLEESASPGENGNVVIAGHRNTGGYCFKDLDKVEEGDLVILWYNEYSFKYVVENVFVVDKYDWSITETVGYPALTLFTCHPYGSTENRLVVRGELDEVQSINFR